MDSYTITITPTDNTGASTTLVVDASDGHVRITDVHMHAADGLSGGQIPAVDLGLLLQAVTTTAPVPALVATAHATAETTPAIEAVVPESDEDTPPPVAESPAPRRRRAPRTAAAPAAPVAEPTRRRGRAKAPAADSAAPRGRAARTAAKTAAVATKAPAKRTARTKVADDTGRVYRRTPDDLAVVFEQLGTVAAVSAHYQVPRHTAQGWVHRLRNSR